MAHAPTDQPSTETAIQHDGPLRPETALPLLRAHTWHPGTVGVMVRHLMDWLRDTGQREALDALHSIEVADPHRTADTVLLADIAQAERRAAAEPHTPQAS